jgi:hypothetical protein
MFVTWNANSGWGLKLGYNAASLADMNRRAITLLQEIRAESETDQSRMVSCGCLGPHGDGSK